MPARYLFAVSYMDGEYLGKIFEGKEAFDEVAKGSSSIEYKVFPTHKQAAAYLEEKRCDDKPFTESLSNNIHTAKEQPKCLEEASDGTAGLTAMQQKAFELLMSGENVFITGSGGTGKSYLVKSFIHRCIDDRKKIIVCAPTGIAAVNVGGYTIHRVFRLKPEKDLLDEKVRINSNPTVGNCDVIVIDEISMCRIDLFEYVIRTILKEEEKNKKKIQVVLCGDFFQLPPVVTGRDLSRLISRYGEENSRGYCFKSDYWDALGLRYVILDEVVRQNDPGFALVLDRLRHGDTLCIDHINNGCAKEEIKDAVNLYGRNRDVDTINIEKLDELNTREYLFRGDIQGNVPKELPTPVDLVLKKGCRVMLLTNSSSYQNGSLGTVKSINRLSSSVNVKLDAGGTVSVGQYTWEFYELNGETGKNELAGQYSQIPLKLAYAVTIHKSQGQTYDAVNLKPHTWDHGQLYVALSRVRSLSSLYLYSPLKRENVKVSQEVIDFYEHISDKSRIM